MGRIVCKFGGTSLAGTAQLAQVARIVRADPRRRLVVASAPGRRAPGDDKITDLLISRSLTHAQNRLQQLADDAGAPVRVCLPQDADDEFIASRGEYYCARILAHALGYDFADAADLIRFDDDGTLNQAKTAAAIRARLCSDRPTVIPGFYGAMPNGRIHTLPRGGSDTTGALIAAAVKADLYENFTDVPGLFDADPALIPDAQPVSHAAYDEVRLLAHCGAAVLHEDAIAPVQRAGVPIHLRSTFAPHLPGTVISLRPSDRPLISAAPAGDRARCAVTGRISNAFLPALMQRFPDADVAILPYGLTFALSLGHTAAVRLLYDLLQK